MPVQYVPVAEDESGDPIEVPTEPDGRLLLSSLAAQFPGAGGLRYRSPETGAMRAVKLLDGVLWQPSELESWRHDGPQPLVYVCTKQRVEQQQQQSSDDSKQRQRDGLRRCTDLIVLGLPYKADEEQLREHFAEFGQVVLAQVKRDHEGNSKGYGFIRFRDYDSQASCLAARHQMDGRRCEVKIPNSQTDSTVNLSKRVFVGRLTEELTDPVLREYFGQFGEVEEIYIPKPFRSFAFVTFADSDTAASLIGRDCLINGVSVQVGPANPKQQTRNAQRYQTPGGGVGGLVGGGGGNGGGGGGGLGSAPGPLDFGAPPPGMGAWGPPAPAYHDVVNSLVTNPQLLAAALQQVYVQGGVDAQPQSQQPEQQQQQQQQLPPPPQPQVSQHSQQQPQHSQPQPQPQPQQQPQPPPGQASPHYAPGYPPYHQQLDTNGHQYQHQLPGHYGYQQHEQHQQQLLQHQQWQ